MDIKQLIYLCNLERERHFGRAPPLAQHFFDVAQEWLLQ
ncbi:hypothetical protein YERSI8AC_190081 [Enterobacterales bacterium 8AC]|jgi:hypothetical protein|nr:hypothetical protein YERSI8AC_190081 [Enterobacterales bacterium 8AC]